MNATFRVLLSLCILAGFCSGMVHKGFHHSHDDCGAPHSHDADGDHGDHGGNVGGDEGKDAPHHHNCCHFPTADCTPDWISRIITFQPILVEISSDDSLIPEEPVFALDKPPLI